MCRARICSVYMPTSQVQSKTENTIFPPLKIREKVTYSKSTRHKLRESELTTVNLHREVK